VGVILVKMRRAEKTGRWLCLEHSISGEISVLSMADSDINRRAVQSWIV